MARLKRSLSRALRRSSASDEICATGKGSAATITSDVSVLEGAFAATHK